MKQLMMSHEAKRLAITHFFDSAVFKELAQEQTAGAAVMGGVSSSAVGQVA